MSRAYNILLKANEKHLRKSHKANPGESPREYAARIRALAETGEGCPYSALALDRSNCCGPSWCKSVILWWHLTQNFCDVDLQVANDLSRISDWTRVTDGLRQSMSWAEVLAKVQEWHTTQFENVIGPTADSGIHVADLADGYKIVQLTTPEQLNYESKHMKHCVKTYANNVKFGASEIYSLRNKDNIPEVTIEKSIGVGDQKWISQVYGVRNSTLTPYQQSVIEPWLMSISGLVNAHYKHYYRYLPDVRIPQDMVDDCISNLTEINTKENHSHEWSDTQLRVMTEITVWLANHWSTTPETIHRLWDEVYLGKWCKVTFSTENARQQILQQCAYAIYNAHAASQALKAEIDKVWEFSKVA